jgi:hypothetical protein
MVVDVRARRWQDWNGQTEHVHLHAKISRAGFSQGAPRHQEKEIKALSGMQLIGVARIMSLRDIGVMISIQRFGTSLTVSMIGKQMKMATYSGEPRTTSSLTQLFPYSIVSE